jgi:hypothetical protein
VKLKGDDWDRKKPHLLPLRESCATPDESNRLRYLKVMAAAAIERCEPGKQKAIRPAATRTQIELWLRQRTTRLKYLGLVIKRRKP